jgi:hypothetical protein
MTITIDRRRALAVLMALGLALTLLATLSAAGADARRPHPPRGLTTEQAWPLLCGHLGISCAPPVQHHSRGRRH